MKRLFCLILSLLLATPLFAQVRPFSRTGDTITLSATDTSSNSDITIKGATSLLVSNIGSATAYFRCGSGTQTAVTTDTPIFSGVAFIVAAPGGTTNCAAITAASTATVFITPGIGMTYALSSTTSGNWVYSDSSASIIANTADNADSSSLCLSGGGACNVTQGANLTLYGNEHVTGSGSAYLKSGNNTDADLWLTFKDSLYMQPAQDANRRFTFGAASDTAHTLMFGDGGTTDTQTFHISGSTPDEGDDSRVCVGGGGAVGTTRGSYFCADGSENGGSFIINIPDKAGASYVNRIYNSTGTWQYAEAYGTTWSKRIVTTTVTPSGATTDTSNFIPAGSVVHGCTARVITAITGATTWSMGITTDTDRYGTGFAVALDTVTTSTNWVPATAGEGVEWHTNAATVIRLTAAGSNFTGGSVRIGCMVDSMGAPSS